MDDEEMMDWVEEDSVSGMCEDVRDDEEMMYWVGGDFVRDVRVMCEDVRGDEVE